ncbi:MAG TPA: DUF3054 domain-containing protein [Microbacterium sp.]|nr:DUF3054 domain-containing protein [Microbacterium sp.]
MRFVPAIILDAVLVLVFAAIGRASHEEDPAGFLLTAWPFLVALLIGHALAGLLGRRPRRPWSVLWGVIVWIVTVAAGMLLRIATGDTAQLPFIIVATLTLGVFLIGWRAAAGLLRRRRATSSTGAPTGHSGESASADFPARESVDGAGASDPDRAG